jgi:hypothetical protein
VEFYLKENSFSLEKFQRDVSLTRELYKSFWRETDLKGKMKTSSKVKASDCGSIWAQKKKSRKIKKDFYSQPKKVKMEGEI